MGKGKKKYIVQMEDLYPEPEWNKVRMIGEGSYGDVWLFQRGEENVAVKRFSKREIESEEAFQSEVNGFKKAKDHVHIVTFLHAYKTSHFLCIALEYCVEGSLDALVRHKYTELELREVVVQCSSALEHMRHVAVVHRDIKPENIFVRRWKPLNVAIGDFNYAKAVNGPYNTTVMETNLGTTFYKAPELDEKLFRNEDNRYNYKVDVFALGMVAYEFISLGVRPVFTLPDNIVEDLKEKHKDGGLKVKYDVARIKALKRHYEKICSEGVKLLKPSQWDLISDEGVEVISQMILPLYAKRCNYGFILKSSWAKMKFNESDLQILNSNCEM